MKDEELTESLLEGLESKDVLLVEGRCDLMLAFGHEILVNRGDGVIIRALGRDWNLQGRDRSFCSSSLLGIFRIERGLLFRGEISHN